MVTAALMLGNVMSGLDGTIINTAIPAIVAAYGDKALIGAGTVLKPEQVDQLAEIGCKLIVTPNIQPEVIRRAVRYGMTVCPGCATASEAFTALDAGAQALKIFPSSAFGPDYIKAFWDVVNWDEAAARFAANK